MLLRAGKLPFYSDVDEKGIIIKHSPKKATTLDIQTYSNNIEFILLARSCHGYNAATTHMERPNIEDENAKNVGTLLNPNVVVGTFAGAQVALIKADQTDNIREVITDAKTSFPQAQHIVCISLSSDVHQREIHLADVLISSGVTSVQNYHVERDESETTITLEGKYNELTGKLQQIFSVDTKVENNFKVSTIRVASYFACNMIENIATSQMPKSNSVKILGSNFTVPVHCCVIGCDTDGTQLLQLKNEGVISDFVLIISVIGYNNETTLNDKWKFTSSMAAVHCIQQKIASFMCKFNALIIRSGIFSASLFLCLIDHKNSVDCYLSALESSKDDILDVMVAKLIFLGPSLQGKTVTRQRLTKIIKNLFSNLDRDASNTGVSEQSTVMVTKKDYVRVTAMADSEDNWSVVDIEDEFLLCMNMSTSREIEKPQLAMEAKPLFPATVRKDRSEESPGNLSNVKAAAETSKISNVEEPKIPPKKTTTSTVAPKQHSISAAAVTWTNQWISQHLETRKHYNLEQMRRKLGSGNLLYMQDTGGQPELMECLPALTIGPALYLLFCNLSSDLDKCYKIGYRGSDGNTLPGLSNVTVRETMLTALASIASMSCSSYSTNTVLEQDKDKWACVYIVGTHKDLVNNDDIDEYENNLKEYLKATFFYQEGIIKWWHKEDFPSTSNISQTVKERLIYPIDNMHGDDEEMQCLRKSILDRLHAIHGKKRIPSQWLLFSILLRKNKENFISLQSCFELGEKLNMKKEDVKSVLHFLHYNLGICMYFHNVPALQDIVITNTQAVFKRLTVLIEAAHKTFKEVDKAARERFREYGKFSVAKFKVLGDDILPLEKLVLILSHLNIIAPLQQPSGISGDVYFMPCVLQNASEKELEDFRLRCSQNKLPSLFVYYTCGFVPLGIFPAMVAHFYRQIKDKVCETWINFVL